MQGRGFFPNMDSGHLFFDPSCQVQDNNMLSLGGADSVFRGQRSMLSMSETSWKTTRSFFTSPEELYNDEYYDEQMPEKKRRLTQEQVHMLEKSFETENKLEPERKTQLAKKLGMQPRQVAVWFQNRRARWKTKQLERDYDQLKSSYDSLMADYDSIIKENEKLKAEAVSMTEKLLAKGDIGVLQVSDDKPEQNPTDAVHFQTIQSVVKAEDRLSTGSVGSAVVDEDGPQPVDSGDSCFPSEEGYCEYAALPVDHGGGVQSEEDEGSDDGRSYNFDDVLVTAGLHLHEEDGETLQGWWIWP